MAAAACDDELRGQTGYPWAGGLRSAAGGGRRRRSLWRQGEIGGGDHVEGRREQRRAEDGGVDGEEKG